jgi:hypothetical protein
MDDIQQEFRDYLTEVDRVVAAIPDHEIEARWRDLCDELGLD